jgi:hypothetical protein
VLSAIAVAAGTLAGLALAHAFGESLLVGLGAGAAVAIFGLGVRALASILGTLQRPPSFASARAWFSR